MVLIPNPSKNQPFLCKLLGCWIVPLSLSLNYGFFIEDVLVGFTFLRFNSILSIVVWCCLLFLLFSFSCSFGFLWRDYLFLNQIAVALVLCRLGRVFFLHFDTTSKLNDTTVRQAQRIHIGHFLKILWHFDCALRISRRIPNECKETVHKNLSHWMTWPNICVKTTFENKSNRRIQCRH